MTEQNQNPSADDLDLVASLADASKDAAELWNEFDVEEGAAPGEAMAAEEDEASAARDGNSGEGDGGTAQDDDAPADKGKQPAAADPGAGKEEDGAQQPDIWSTAPPELKKAYEDMEQKFRSEQGRAKSFQQRLTEVTRQPQSQAPKPQKQGSAADRLAALKEEFPEFVEPLSQALGTIEEQLSQLSQAEQSRQQAAQTDFETNVMAQTRELESAHPDYLDVIGQNEAAFVAWLDDQPGSIRRAFQRNQEYIQDAAEASQVIAAFKAHLKPPAGTPAADTTEQPAELSDKRKRQLQATAAPQGKGRRPTVQGIPEDGDPQAIWDAFDREERAQAR